MDIERAIKIGNNCKAQYNNGLFFATREIKLGNVIEACQTMAHHLTAASRRVSYLCPFCGLEYEKAAGAKTCCKG